MNSTKIRLNKAIAQRSQLSRRAADTLIQQGVVRVSKQLVTEPGLRVGPEDRITIKNRPLLPPQRLQYYMLHKARKSISTTYDPQGRPTVMQAFKKISSARLFPVGRLDGDAEGLLLVTNDGHLAQRILHPRHGVTKTYLVKLNDKPEVKQLQRLTRGLSTRVGRIKALNISRVYNKGGGTKNSPQRPWYKVVVVDGKNRELHHMFNHIGLQVLKIQRVAIGGLKLKNLKKGAIKELGARDLQRIFQSPSKTASDPSRGSKMVKRDKMR